MNAAGIAAVVAAYLIGSLSFAVLLVRTATGKDIRDEGSGNAGATNVLRAHGKALGLAVGILDVGKGTAAVLLARVLTDGDVRAMAAAAVAAVLGHVFPVFYGFRGGKGVATALGAFLALSPWAALASFGLMILVVGATRYVSLGSMLGMAAMPLFAGIVFASPVAVVAAGAAIAVLVIVKHRENIARLSKGQERKLGSS
ncbi:MAG TPA: glycerol-3-phosphate 1-O-acyltransferase PlsY [Thermoanaerobaculia bacterium]|jgi:glycerol-3-phosphate acyltransferase PlsY